MNSFRSQLPRPDGRLRSRLRTGLVRGLPVCRPGWVVGCVRPVPVQRPGLQGKLTVAQPRGTFALGYSYQPLADVLRRVVVAVEFVAALVAREPAVRIAVRTRLVAALRARLRRERRVHVFDSNAVLGGFVRDHLLQLAKRPIVHLPFDAVVRVVHPVADVRQSFNGDVRTIVEPGFFDESARNGVQTIQDEAVFSSRHLPKRLLGGTSVFVLEAPTNPEIVVLAPQQFATIEEAPRAGHGDVLQVQIDAENAVAVALFDLLQNDDVEVEGVLVGAVVQRPHPPLVLVVVQVRPLVVAEDVLDFDPPVDRREGRTAVVDG